MQVTPTRLPEVKLIRPDVHGDARGFFLESYNRAAFERAGIVRDWVQDNHSRSQAHVLRGLHFQVQTPQAKLVRVVRGSVFDVAVDVRTGSPRFGQWVGVTLTGENKQMLFIPEGFAHGFLVLEDETDFVYKCSAYYAPENERGVLWDDPSLAIEWPLPVGVTPMLSTRDRAWGPLASLAEPDLGIYEDCGT